MFGSAALVAAAALEVVNLSYHKMTTVTITGAKPDLTTTATAGSSAPSVALITAVAGGGILLLLGDRPTSHVLLRLFCLAVPSSMSGRVRLLTGVIAAKTDDPDDAAELYKRSAPRVLEVIAKQSAPTTRVAVTRQIAWNTESLVDAAHPYPDPSTMLPKELTRFEL